MNIMAVRLGQLYKGTEAERALEDAIGALGVPYRFQFPGYLYGVRFFPDFFLPTLKLVIEVDDDSHRRAEKIEADRERTSILEREWGCRVVRCTNKEALDNPHGTVRALLSSVGLWPIPSRLPSIAASLPRTKKAPKKAKREAVAKARQDRRRGSSGRRRNGGRASPARPTPPPTPERHQAPGTHQEAAEVLRPAPIHPVCQPPDYCAALDPDNFCRNCTC